MSTATEFRSYTCKDLAQLAKKRGISGWHSMRKDELVDALVLSARKNGNKKTGMKSRSKTLVKASTSTRRPARRPTAVQKRLKRVYEAQGRQKDLSTQLGSQRDGSVDDRVVLMVRDPNWLQATWEVSAQAIERVKAAFAQSWHTANPVLRLLEVPPSGSNDSAEHVLRVVPINGMACTWFIDVLEPPKSYRVELGYESGRRFLGLARSNTVTTPAAEGTDRVEGAVADVVENSARIFALSGGYETQSAGNELRLWLENRLEHPLGGPVACQFGEGAEAILDRPSGMQFHVDAEMIIRGGVRPDAFVTISGEPVALNEDGTFIMRIGLPERRRVLPIVATSRNGAEEQTIILAIEHNTKVLEPVIRELGK